MSRSIGAVTLALLMWLAGAGIGFAQPPQDVPRSPSQETAPTETAAQPTQTIVLSTRNTIVDWIIVAALTAVAVFAVGRSSWRG